MAGAVALAATLAYSPPAAAAAPGDPVASGSLKLTLSRGFKSQLKSNGVKMSRREFTIKKGAIDPTNGSGSVTFSGKLKFKGSDGKLVFKKVTATLGGGGVLKGDGTKLFKLSSGKVERNGFGAEITGINAKLHRKGIRKINRKLGLSSLHKGKVGTAAFSEQPKTVRVTGGQTNIVPSLAGDSVAFKLVAHCINPLTGVEAIAPAVKHLDAAFDFPASGGTIGPNGKDGVVLHAGGSRINKDPLNDLGACGAVPDNANIEQTNLQFDLGKNRVFGDAKIGGYGPPLGGPKGTAIAFDIRAANAVVNAHANNKRITVSGQVLVLSEASAQFLNLVFPNNTGDATRDFKAGDVFGTASTTVDTR